MSATDTEPVFFNPLEPGYAESPHGHLAEMREGDPVHKSLIDNWILFAYDDVFRLLRDPALSVDDANADMTNSERIEMFTKIAAELGTELQPNTSILNVDPPDHTRLRKLVSKAFTPGSIEALRPGIQEMVDDALDRIEAAGQADVIDELAFPLPFDVITEMLGMPRGDVNQIRDWSEAIVKTLDPIISDEEFADALRADIHMSAHIAAVIETKRSNPGDDLLTRMIEAEEGGDRMSATELKDQVSLLFIAGHETTVNLIGTGIYELLRHPDQLQLLLDDPSLIAGAVDELLRYVSPVQFSRRITTSDVEYGGRTIPKGQFVLACLASANRDPAKFGPTADALDITRTDAGQLLSLGSGAHYCLGASLAKLEAQIAIGSFIERFGQVEVVEAEFNGRINLRGLGRLQVRVG